MFNETTRIAGIRAAGLSTNVDLHRLMSFLLIEPWHLQCEIILDYVAPFDKEKHFCVVRYVAPGVEENLRPSLRYSQGPRQGFFWDIYGDDFQSPELAVIAISKAPAPISVTVATKGSPQ